MSTPSSRSDNPSWGTFLQKWRELCRQDDELGFMAAMAGVTFEIRSGRETITVKARESTVELTMEGGHTSPSFTVSATPESWSRFLERVPEPPYQSIFGMLMRIDETVVGGDELSFAQHAHLVRCILDLARRAASADSGDDDETSGEAFVGGDIVGRYCRLNVQGQDVRIFYEESGDGAPILCLHTAGADSRQFHRLMSDPRLLGNYRMVAFDLPWHGRSMPPEEAVFGSWALTTNYYANCVKAFIDELDIRDPIVLGSSMAGEICLELAYRYPDSLRGVIACEASDHVPGRHTEWARHPKVNQALFIPEWVSGLMAPESPRSHRREVWWGYSQGGFGTFFGDILFYSGDWDGRDRVSEIDTAKCPVLMLTGEYDYSCTPEMSKSTADKIPGAVFKKMSGLGHFPMTENPSLFVGYLLEALDDVESRQ